MSPSGAFWDSFSIAERDRPFETARDASLNEVAPADYFGEA